MIEQFKRITSRVDYYCLKTKRYQAKVFVDYYRFDEKTGIVLEVVPAKYFQKYKRREQRRLK